MIKSKKADWYLDTQSQAGLYHWFSMQDGHGCRPRSLCSMYLYGPWSRQQTGELSQDEQCPECRERFSGYASPKDL